MSTDYPILSGEHPDAKDERSQGVVLLHIDEDTKGTAEDCGLYWYIRDWEVYEMDGVKIWFARSGYTIRKSVVKMLARLP